MTRAIGAPNARAWRNARRLASLCVPCLLVVLAGTGCATTKQSVAEVNEGLTWFVAADQADGWPSATEAGARLEHAPTVVIAWSPAITSDPQGTALPTRVARERWIAAIKEKLDRSGKVTHAEGSPPDTFDGGATLAGIQRLAADRGADLVVLFGLETDKRQYHVFEPLAGPTRSTADVANVIEVVTLGRTVGLVPSGVPLFADSQKGFASGESHARTLEELQAISHRVAVDALADAIVRRLTQLSPGKRKG